MNRVPLSSNAALVAATVTVLMLCAHALGRQSSAPRACVIDTPVEMTGLLPSVSARQNPTVARAFTLSPTAAGPEAVTDTPGVQSDEEDKVRQVARDFVKQKFPGIKVDGVSALPFWPEHLYLAGVDTIRDGDHQTVDLLMRSYTRRNGSSYWQPTLLSGEEAMRMRLRITERQ